MSWAIISELDNQIQYNLKVTFCILKRCLFGFFRISRGSQTQFSENPSEFKGFLRRNRPSGEGQGVGFEDSVGFTLKTGKPDIRFFENPQNPRQIGKPDSFLLPLPVKSTANRETRMPYSAQTTKLPANRQN